MMPFAAMRNRSGGSTSPVISTLLDIDLYTGNGGTSRSVASVDLSSGGLVWVKSRNQSQAHGLIYSPNGASPQLVDMSSSAGTAAGATFSPTGFAYTNATFDVNTRTYVAWAMRRASRFFDVVTYTGTGVAHTIAHNLGVDVGQIWIKRVDSGNAWVCYDRSLGNARSFNISVAQADVNAPNAFNSTSPTTSVFTVGTDNGTNISGGSFVAMVFAHDTATDGVIQEFTYAGNGTSTGPDVTLGWQPQWVLILNRTTTTRSLVDQTRTPSFTGSDASIMPESTAAESSGARIELISGGFRANSSAAFVNAAGTTYFGLAIRAP